VGPLKGANTGKLNEVFGVMPIACYAQRESPQAWEHARQQGG
jgi:hypothetical protein